MKKFMDQIFRLVFRVALLLAGLVFFSSLLVLAILLLGWWLVRAMWARLTGQPVSPWVFTVDPRAQWNGFNRGPGDSEQGIGRAARPGPASGSGHVAEVADVTDVVAREIEPKDHLKDKSPRPRP